MDGTSKTQFKAVLSARTNDGRPSDLEFLLRSHCQKIKVVKKLSGAHVMIKQDKISLAVRAYFSHDLQDLNDNESQSTYPSGSEENYDFDDLYSFLKGFKVAIIFFILPIEEQRKQLDDPLSFFQKAQKLVQQLTQSEMGKIARVYLLSNTGKAVDLLHSFAKTLHPLTEEKKQKYFAQKHKQLFLPQPTFIPIASHPDGAKHVRETIRAWADRFEFPPTEADVMCNMMNNLKTIASADSRVLQGLPLDPRTKDCTMQFFGTGPLEEEEPIPSQQIHLGAPQDPTSPLTMQEDIRQQQLQLQQEQGQQQASALHRHPPQYQLQSSQRPYSTQPPMQRAPMMPPQQSQLQMQHGLARFGDNNPNQSHTVVQQTNSFAQYSNPGFSMSSQQSPQPNSHGRFGPPTRTIYQETILTAAAMPNNHFHSQQQVPQQMQYPIQNPPPDSVVQHHHHHHHQQPRPPCTTNPPVYPPHSGQPSSLHYPPRLSQQSSVASHQQHYNAMHQSPMTATNPVHTARMGMPPYHQQQQSTPMTTAARPRQMQHSVRRNHSNFPPRRQRRFVP